MKSYIKNFNDFDTTYNKRHSYIKESTTPVATNGLQKYIDFIEYDTEEMLESKLKLYTNIKREYASSDIVILNSKDSDVNVDDASIIDKWIDNDESWDYYPKRQTSIICHTNNFYKRQGDIYVVLPLKNSGKSNDYGVFSADDFYETFTELQKQNKTYKDIKEVFDDYLLYISFVFCKSYENLKSISYDEFIDYLNKFDNLLVSIGDDAIKLLDSHLDDNDVLREFESNRWYASQLSTEKEKHPDKQDKEIIKNFITKKKIEFLENIKNENNLISQVSYKETTSVDLLRDGLNPEKNGIYILSLEEMCDIYKTQINEAEGYIKKMFRQLKNSSPSSIPDRYYTSHKEEPLDNKQIWFEGTGIAVKESYILDKYIELNNITTNNPRRFLRNIKIKDIVNIIKQS